MVPWLRQNEATKGLVTGVANAPCRAESTGATEASESRTGSLEPLVGVRIPARQPRTVVGQTRLASWRCADKAYLVAGASIDVHSRFTRTRRRRFERRPGSVEQEISLPWAGANHGKDGGRGPGDPVGQRRRPRGHGKGVLRSQSPRVATLGVETRWADLRSSASPRREPVIASGLDGLICERYSHGAMRCTASS